VAASLLVLTEPGIVRLAAQPGAVDPSFRRQPGADNSVFSLLALPDGGLIVGGAFNQVNGTAATHLARLTAEGEVDPTFTASLDFHGPPLT